MDFQTKLSFTSAIRLAFAMLMTCGTYFIHSSTFLTLWELVGSFDGVYNLRGGFLIPGTCLFMVSIALEYVWINVSKTSGMMYLLHGAGNVLLIGASISMTVIPQLDRSTYWQFMMHFPDLIEGFWVAGGLITAVVQSYFAWALKSSNKVLIAAHILGAVGSLLFATGGILGLDAIMNQLRESNHEMTKIAINDIIACLWISGSACYIFHSILYYLGLKDEEMLGKETEDSDKEQEADVWVDKEQDVTEWNDEIA